jgi:ferredoxin
MLINVSNFVENKKSINNRMCIYCERCVSSCDQGVLKLSNKMIER